MSSIRVASLSKTFGNTRALQDISIQIESGEMVALIGASGSGKSTLLRHVAGLAVADRTPASEVQIGGRIVQKAGRLSREVRELRARTGFIFQQFNLVARLPLMTNVLAGLLPRIPKWRSIARRFAADELRLGMEALHRVGIAEQAWQRASTLSGGQQQRAAIARTLVQRARVILADEPIASLDPESSRRVMDILEQINREDGCTVVVSLHQVPVALKYCPRAIALHRGRVVHDGPAKALTASRLREIYGADVEDLLEPPGLGERSADKAPQPFQPCYQPAGEGLVPAARMYA